MTDVIDTGTPTLATVRQVELVHAGRWQISTGIWEPTPDDLIEAVAALDCPAVRRPVIKLGHLPEQPGEPAIGYVDNMATADAGQKVIADLVGMPGWLVTPDANGNTVLASAYPDRSVEGQENFVCQLGHVHRCVITAVALLGVDRPGIGTLPSLQDLAALYGVAASVPVTGRAFAARISEEHHMPPAISAAVSVQDVRRAFYDGPAVRHYAWWVTDVFLDPNYLLVMDDDADVVYQVGFTVNGEEVTFDDPVPGRMVWESTGDAIAASTPRPASAEHFASRADSRPGAPQTPVASASGTTTQEGAGMDPAKLREVLGLPADASNIEVQAALASHGVIPKADEPAAPAAPAAPATPTADAPAAAPVLPDGVVAIDSERLAALEVAARAGQQAADRQRADDRDRLLETAIKAGKFPPARRDHYAAMYDKDPDGTREFVEKTLQAGAVPLTEAGVSGDAGLDEDAAFDAELKRLGSSLV